MKKFFVSLLLCLFSSELYAGSVILNWNQNPQVYEAVCDTGVVAISAGQTLVTSGSTTNPPTFALADVGKELVIVGAGVSGANLVTTVASFVSQTSVRTVIAASTTVTNAGYALNASNDIAGYKVYQGTSSRSYGIPTSVGYVTTYTVNNLVNGTYYFTITAYDACGNESGFSNEVTKTVSSTPDTTPPIISAIQSTGVGNTSATITWTTNEASNSQIEYGLTTTYGSLTILNSSLVTAHSQALSGLITNTLYHFRVKSSDASANLATSLDNSFTTTNTTITLLVDFGKTSSLNLFGLSGWNTVIKDVYTDNRDVGPGGTQIVVGDNGDYNYQGVSGTPHTFVIGDKITVTWYNPGSTITFTPMISFDDPNRRDPVYTPVGTWYSMSSVTIPTNSVGTSQYVLTSVGTYSLINVNGNYPTLYTNQVVICDKVELTPFGSAVVQPAAPGHLVVK